MNGADDLQDILNGVSIDCNGDLVPDECQIAGFDCNHNDILDECDAITGSVSLIESQNLASLDFVGGVAIADFDGDGDRDVAVAGRSVDQIQIFKNNAGTLSAFTTVTACDFPIGITAANFDGDGDIDLAVACLNSDGVGILKNNGGGTFGSVTIVPTNGDPWGISNADLDGDGDTDLAVTNASSTLPRVSILKNTAGVFTKTSDITVGSLPRNAIAGDFDGDGDFDLVSANAGADTLSIIKNNGDGTFAAPTSIATFDQPWGLDVGDIDGDGLDDFAVTSFTADQVRVYKSFGAAGFTLTQTLKVGSDPQALIVTDVTGDGFPDIASANLSTGNVRSDVSVMLNTGLGTFAPALTFCTGAGVNALDGGDLDGDGHPEIVTANSTTDTISAMTNVTSCLDCNGDDRLDVCDLEPYVIGFESSEGFFEGDIQAQSGWYRRRLFEDLGDPGPVACPDFDIPAVNDVGCSQASIDPASPIGTGNALMMFPDAGLFESQQWGAFSPNLLGPEYELIVWEWDARFTNTDGPDYDVWIQSACGEGLASVRLKYEFDRDVRFYDWNSGLFVNTGFKWNANQTVHTKVTINQSLQFVVYEFNGDIWAFSGTQTGGGTQELVFVNDNYTSPSGEDRAWFDNLVYTFTPDCNGNGIDDAQDISDGAADVNHDGVPDECQEDCNGNGKLDPGDCNENRVQDECDIVNETSADCNANDAPDECDIAADVSADCNGNNIPDECDIAAGTSDDVNGNGVADECEDCNGDGELDPNDCNNNDVIDECDLAAGTSIDCNANAVPDECELAGDPDCNANGVLDACDIASGSSADTDGNGVPDECEGAECPADANGDGVVDPLDAGYVLSRFGCPVNAGDPLCDAADVNEDNVVDPLDSGFVLSRFGDCP